MTIGQVLLQKHIQLDLEFTHFENIDHIVFCGMRGSGAVGNLLSAILSKTNQLKFFI